MARQERVLEHIKLSSIFAKDLLVESFCALWLDRAVSVNHRAVLVEGGMHSAHVCGMSLGLNGSSYLNSCNMLGLLHSLRLVLLLVNDTCGHYIANTIKHSV